MPEKISFLIYNLNEFDKNKQLDLIDKFKEDHMFEDFFNIWITPVKALFNGNRIESRLKRKFNFLTKSINPNNKTGEIIKFQFYYNNIHTTHLVSSDEARKIIQNARENLEDEIKDNLIENREKVIEVFDILISPIQNYILGVDEKGYMHNFLDKIFEKSLNKWNQEHIKNYLKSYPEIVKKVIENENVKFSEDGDIIYPKPYFKVINKNRSIMSEKELLQGLDDHTGHVDEFYSINKY